MLRLDPDAVVWSAPESARRERPLLVLLHGRGADEHDLASLMPALPSGFVIASVRAPLAEGPGWSWFEPGRTGQAIRNRRARMPRPTPCWPG